MTTAEAYEILAEFQKWRRGEPPYDWHDIPAENRALPYSGEIIGNALDVALEVLSKTTRKENSAEVSVTGRE